MYINDSEARMTLDEHIRELRRLIIICLIVDFICVIISYYFFRRSLLKSITENLKLMNIPIIYTSVTESFATELRVSLVAGLIGAFPIESFFVWRFISPALIAKEKKLVLRYALISIVLFLLGLMFGYTILLPFILKFFINSEMIGINAMISIDNYVSFLCKMSIPFGFIAEMPLTEYILVKSKLVSLHKLIKIRKYIFLICVIFGAILTPPDVVSQICVALPMYILYECGIVAGRLAVKTGNISD